MILKKSSTRKKLFLVTVVASLLAVGARSIYAGQFSLFMSPVVSNSAADMDQAQAKADSIVHKVHPGATITRTSLMDIQPGNRRVWQVEYKGQGEVDFDAQTGQVTFFYNHKRFDELTANPSSAKKLSRAEAVTKAKGIAGDLSLRVGATSDDASLSVDRGGTSGLSSWEFRWPREKNGYKFHDDFILLGIDAFDGQIIGYNYNWFSDEPASTAVTVNESDAGAVAAKTASENGFGSKAGNGRLVIVNPNYKWTPSFVEMPPKETRLAWDFAFENNDSLGVHAAEIWVDASTGDMLGGESTR